MNNTNTGGPAFPTVMFPKPEGGMTLRDFFAAKAMQGLLAGWTATALPPADMLAPAAYQYADAMLKARSA